MRDNKSDIKEIKELFELEDVDDDKAKKIDDLKKEIFKIIDKD